MKRSSNTVLSLLSAEAIEEYYRIGAWRDETIHAIVRRHAAAAPDRMAVRDRGRRLTYAELLASAEALAADLASRGVKEGQRVAVWLPSRIETLVALLACSRNGYVCCLSLHRDHTVGEVVELVERMRAAILITEPGYGADGKRRDIQASLAGMAFLKHVHALPPLGAEGGPAPFDGLLADAVPPPANPDPNRVVYLAFTSGTTGVPKGVMHSDNTLLATVRAVVEDWSLGSDTVVYSLSPLSHNLGVGAFIAAMVAGGELVINDLPKGASLLGRLVETGANYLVGVPTHAIDLLAELRKRPESPLKAMKGFRISGASVPGEIVAELLSHGIRPQSGYGMTEAGSHHYSLPDDDPRLIIESSGRCCAGYEIRIWDKEDPEREIGSGEIGQIGGRGANLMLGYFNDQIATEESFNAQGWFMTGDLGWVDEDGYVRISGRKKDVIIRGGHNIYPARIEALAMRHDAIQRASAFPVADPRLGEKVCLAVTFREGAELAPRDVLAHLDSAGLSKYDMPEYFLKCDAIPLTSSGKILKRELVAWVEQGKVVPEPIRWSEAE